MSEIVKSIRILFWAFLISPILILTAFTFLRQNGEFSLFDPEMGQLMTFIALGYIPLAIFLANFLGKKKLQEVSPDLPLNQKLETYRNSFVLRLALLEGSSLFILVIYLFTGNMLLLIGMGIILAIQFQLQPTPNKIASELGLDASEKAELDRA